MDPSTYLTDNVGSTSPVGVVFTLVMCLLLLGLPRRYALAPVIILTCFMTLGERLIIAGLDFTMIRVLLIAGWARVMLRSEMQIERLNAIDKTLIAFTISSIVTNTILWGTFGAFINRLGLAYNLLGAYFLFRFLVRDGEDCLRVVKLTAVFIIPLAALMLLEGSTGRNVFALFGGVPEISEIRGGRVRAQGPFGHPILAGTFGATMFPLFVGLLCQEGRAKVLALAAMVSSLLIVLAGASSGPVVALLCGLLGIASWRIRSHMRLVRWGTLSGLAALSFVMKAPIWFLIARVDIFSGSTSFYRAYFIDRAIANFSGWWLVGTRDTRAWADHSLGLQDRTNQYIAVGADGGVFTMLLFILIIVFCFRAVGLTVKTQSDGSQARRFFVWTFGATLFSHAINYISIGYFDQNFINYYLLIAMIATVWQSAAATIVEREHERVGVTAWSVRRATATASPAWPKIDQVAPGTARLRPAPRGLQRPMRESGNPT